MWPVTSSDDVSAFQIHPGCVLLFRQQCGADLAQSPPPEYIVSPTRATERAGKRGAPLAGTSKRKCSAAYLP